MRYIYIYTVVCIYVAWGKVGKAKYVLLKVVHSLHIHKNVFLMYSLLMPASVIYCLHAPCHLFMSFGLEAKMVRKSSLLIDLR